MKAESSAVRAVLAAAAFSASPLLAAPHSEVTITNITKAQSFATIIVASHKSGVKLFSLGSPASVELEHLAEAGDTGPLAVLLQSNPDVKDVNSQGAGSVLAPGASVTLSVDTGDGFNSVSAAAMLLPTNDGFFAIVDAAPPTRASSWILKSPAYDAGTEANDEDCAHVPGPPDVCNGEAFNPSRDGAEGFVHIHEGIHGIADLPANIWDWRNPVALVAITRVP